MHRSLYLILFTMLLSVVVMFGYFTGSSALIQISPSFAPVQFNTALCIFLFSLSFALYNTKAALFVSLIPGIIATTTLCQYIFGVNLGLDELLFDHKITTNTSHPGRMAPNTAVSFMFISLFFLFKNVHVRITSSISLISMASVALLGYLIGLPGSARWFNLTAMAVITSLSVMSFGLLSIQKINIKKYLNNITYLMILPMSVISMSVFISILGPLSVYSESHDYAELISGMIMCLMLSLSICLFMKSKAMIKNLIKTEAELKDKTEVLEKTKAELESFAYVVSHDLKAPLRAISNLNSWMTEDIEEQNFKLSASYYEKADLLQERTKRMSLLIDGILDLSRITREDQDDEVDLNDAFNEAKILINSFDGFEITKINELPTIRFNRTRTIQLFVNLINNAVKHHDKTSGTVKVYCEGNIISVEDDGPGIDQKYREKVFGMFSTLQAKTNNGLGIGLGLCKKIVEEWNGRIWIEDAEDRGCIFKFTVNPI